MSGMRLTRRVAEETQLLAEEKWISEALNKVRKQRNCLQIERLQLESMKAQMKIELEKKGSEDKPNKCNMETKIVEESKQMPEKMEFKALALDEEFCNKEQLNLSVNKSLFGPEHVLPDFNIEEEEDDINEDVFIEMNMLMNGTQSMKGWNQ